MSAIEIVSGIILMVAAVAIIALVLLQKSNGRGLSGTLTGGSVDMMGGRASSNEAKAAQLTKICGVVFAVVCVIVCVVSARMG